MKVSEIPPRTDKDGLLIQQRIAAGNVKTCEPAESADAKIRGRRVIILPDVRKLSDDAAKLVHTRQSAAYSARETRTLQRQDRRAAKRAKLNT